MTIVEDDEEMQTNAADAAEETGTILDKNYNVKEININKYALDAILSEFLDRN